MAKPCTVLIAPADLLPTLKSRASEGGGELLAFTDAEALRALDAITQRRPAIVALERQFASTPRGAALINRIKADPSLIQSKVLVVSHETDYSRPASRKAAESAAASATVPAPSGHQQLDQRGTRRAPRYPVAGSTEVLVDGNQAMLVDLSTIGAQVLSPTVLKPNQRVRMSLADDQGTVRFNASVAWASFEIPARIGPRYRAGIEFLDADGTAVDAFGARHKAS